MTGPVVGAIVGVVLGCIVVVVALFVDVDLAKGSSKVGPDVTEGALFNVGGSVGPEVGANTALLAIVGSGFKLISSTLTLSTSLPSS